MNRLGLAVVAGAALVYATEATAAESCAPSVYAAITSPAPKNAPPFPLTCSLSLAPGDVVRRKLLLQGAAASGVTIDCNGAQIGDEAMKITKLAPTIAIMAQREGTASEPAWSRPTDVTIRGCQIYGAMLLWGIGPVADFAFRAQESRNPDFTARAQSAAPTRVQIVDSEFHATPKVIPIYLGPGTTAFSLTGSTLSGSAHIAIYMDAETADNRIENNKFPLRVEREIISVDGSAGNVIRNNDFSTLGERGGITLYRNCGEKGIIRHQTPSNNQITDNRFDMGQDETKLVIENSRSGGRKKPGYCVLDAGYPFGSSVNDDDLGHDNQIKDNKAVLP